MISAKYFILFSYLFCMACTTSQKKVEEVDVETDADTLTRLQVSIENHKTTESDIPLAYAISQHFITQGKFQEALPFLKFSFEKTFTLDSGLTLSGIYQELQKYEESLDVLEKLMALYPDSFEVQSKLTEIYLFKGTPAQIEGSFKNLQKSVKTEAEAQSVLRLLYYKKDPSLIQSYLKEISQKFPHSNNIKIEKARFLMDESKFKESLKLIEEVHQSDPHHVEALILLGLLQLRQNQEEQGLLSLERALQLAPHHQQLLQMLVNIYAEKKDFKKLESLYQDSLMRQGSENSLPGLIQYGHILLNNKKYPQAENIFIKILEKEPKNEKVLFLLGWTYESQKKYSQAAHLYSQIPENTETYKEALLRLFQVHVSQNNTLLAHDALQKYQEYFPQEVSLYAEGLNLLGRGKEALQILEKQVIETQGADVSLWMLYAITLYNQNKIKESLEETKRLLEIYPTHDSALNFLAYTYACLNQNLKEAEEILTKLVEKYPDNEAYLDSLGWVYFRQNETLKAEKLILKASQLSGDHPVILSHLAQIYEKQKRFKEAGETYIKASELFEKTPPLRLAADKESLEEFRIVQERLYHLRRQVQP